MIMRTHKIVTHLRPEDACTLVEFPDQWRDALMQAYGDGSRIILQEAPPPAPKTGEVKENVF